jgi:hypothetical protein
LCSLTLFASMLRPAMLIASILLETSKTVP